MPTKKKPKEYIDPILFEEGIITKKDGMKAFLKGTNKVLIVAANSKRYASHSGTVVMSVSQLKSGAKTSVAKVALSGIKPKVTKKSTVKKVTKK